jgi:iron complex outermembrane receptor protein
MSINAHLLCCSMLLAAYGSSASSAFAQESDASRAADQTAPNLKRLSLEDLADLEVSTASRRLERLGDTAAAVSVIRSEDIRRAGATSLADALRLADGVHVAQVYGPGWAISTRGFNISTANKLLVLIDGRTVYSPLFSGVFWDVQDIVLADVDRIEVVRGPGGTLWGANAVNGVVNIITKRTIDTPGGLVSLSAGNETRAIATGRYGGRLGSDAWYRVYGKVRADDQHVFATGVDAQDDMKLGQAGFRIDSNDAAVSFWTVQGDLYAGAEGVFDRTDTRVSGGNLLARFTRRWSSTSRFQAQVYYDRTFRRVERQYRATRDTFDIDTQQQFQWSTRHALVFGAGFRASRGDDLGDGPGFFFDPQVRTSTLGSVFAQDEMALKANTLFLVVGSKVEHNDFTGFEIQPNVRVRWTPSTAQTIWGSVSRAVRMPTRFDTDLRIRLPNTERLLLTGSEDFASETVVAYEAGYRARPAAWASIESAVFANSYGDLRSQEPPQRATDPLVLSNGLNARTSGVEIAGTFSVRAWWQAHTAYSYLWEQFSRDAESRDLSGGASEANDPAHLFSVRSSFDLPGNVEADAFFRFASTLPQPRVARYAEMNMRLGWRARPNWELSLVAQNLLHPRHEEFAAGTPRELFERGAFVRSLWRF